MRVLLVAVVLLGVGCTATPVRKPGATADLTVRFVQPTPPDPEQMFVCAFVDEDGPTTTLTCVDKRAFDTALEEARGMPNTRREL